MRSVCLFIDESGDANPRVTSSPVYILAGCMIDDENRQKLKIGADQIKFKYWSRTDIVFHSREIGRKEGDFKIFADRSTLLEFQKDLFTLLHSHWFQMFFVLVDKKGARKNNWNHQKTYEETARRIVRNFILSLLAQENVKGRLIVESATSEKDFYFHKAVSHYLSQGLPELGISFEYVQHILTEVSFVTKKNHDIEEQVADVLAYGAKLRFLGKKEANMTSYEKGIIKVLKAKLFRMDPNTGEKKKKYYSHIDSFNTIP
ncbi:MAG: hypothetical protein A2804_03515 [Candidatus Pacebacteria bacterium RIFCSPHIGHO2_01_FULL_46_10]|nr:MAG: hypothetical protein A2804_03515 [Candidatus Pacebacteria bacterium RIFCSPHIGHO2_01_FULL_46_10]